MRASIVPESNVDADVRIQAHETAVAQQVCTNVGTDVSRHQRGVVITAGLLDRITNRLGVRPAIIVRRGVGLRTRLAIVVGLMLWFVG